jgi:menaquinone-dependent protoporphyrinogen oxidase
MSRILIAYASFDGQTRRIAERIGATLMDAGHAVTMRPAVEGPALAAAGHDAVIVGGAVRVGHHSRALERAVRAHASQIASRPNAFFSVSLSAANNAAAAQGCIDAFVRRTGWTPQRSASFPGALPYTRYNPFIRLLMRFIVGRAGGDTDTSRDYEYTRWEDVERFAREFAARLVPIAANTIRR